MKIQVFDVGNTFTKDTCFEIKDGGDSLDSRCVTSGKRATLPNMLDTFHLLDRVLDENQPDAAIFLSMSDNITLLQNSTAVWIPASEPRHPYAPPETRPPFAQTGTSPFSSWQGITNTLALARRMITGFTRVRVLPVSAACAAHLAGENYFNTWDITHASNSGIFSFQIPSPDPRYPQSGWHPYAYEYIERGWINKDIVKCNYPLKHKKTGIPLLIGGHDSTFANANDIPFSTKAYISLGSWMTASVESSVRPDWVDAEENDERYLIAPNGSILKQICFENVGAARQKDKLVDFMKRHLTHTTSPILIFGGWDGIEDASASICKSLGKDGFRWALKKDPHFLSECAATYAYNSLK